MLDILPICKDSIFCRFNKSLDLKKNQENPNGERRRLSEQKFSDIKTIRIFAAEF